MKFHELALVFEQIEQVTSRLAITEFLAELFKKASPEEIGEICYLLEGRVAPRYEAVEFGVADKFMIRALAQAAKIEPDVVAKEYRHDGDLGITAQKILAHHKDGGLSIHHVFTLFTAITGTSGAGSQEQKINQIAELLSQADAISARYIVRIPLGKLRLGFSDMTILDSLSWMIGKDKSLREHLEQAYNVRPDIGFIASAVKEHGINGLAKVKAVVGAPILSALCQRLPTADEMVEKMGEVSVDPKYDGVRVQIHYEEPSSNLPAGQAGNQEPKVKTFSRNLENTTEMFPELEAIGKELNASEVILDSEAVGVDPKTGNILPFQETTTRKRKHGIQLALATVPLKFFVFDILYKDGKDLLSEPLSKRREILEKTLNKKENLLALAPHIVTDIPDNVRSYHEEQRKKGLEGVVVKKWHGSYEPGRRNYSWVKFKEEEGSEGKLSDTIDAVVMGYYRGEGKRSSFGIGAFLVGVRDGETYKTITKVGTGVSDDQWRELKALFEPLTVHDQPKQYKDVHKSLIPDVWIDPKVVVEIAGDDLTKSSTHGSVYAVRFPKLVRVRDDKSPEDVTTTDEIRQLFKNQ